MCGINIPQALRPDWALFKFLLLLHLIIFDQWPGIQAPLLNQQLSAIAPNAALRFISSCTATGLLRHFCFSFRYAYTFVPSARRTGISSSKRKRLRLLPEHPCTEIRKLFVLNFILIHTCAY